eukprot:m51a1_g12383 putative dual specificity (264) ;mRNA; r:632020-633204
MNSQLYNELASDTAIVIDCRSQAEFDAGHVRGAVAVPSAASESGRSLFSLISQLRPSAAHTMRFALWGPAAGAVQELLDDAVPGRAVAVGCGEGEWRSAYPALWVAPGGRGVDPALEDELSTDTMPSEVLPGFLYLGGWLARSWAHALGITHVVNCCAENPPNAIKDSASGLRSLYLPLLDLCEYDIAAHVEPFVEFVDRARAERGRVLVHCMAGISRSATMVMVYLIRSEGMSYEQASAHARACRSRVDPNDGSLSKHTPRA